MNRIILIFFVLSILLSTREKGFSQGHTTKKIPHENGYRIQHYNSKGKLIRIQNYNMKNQLHGEEKSFYEDGSINDQQQYTNGKKTGTWTSYFDSGEINVKKRHVGDSTFSTTYLKDGSVFGKMIYYQGKMVARIFTYSDGAYQSYNDISSGIQKGFYPSGQLKYTGTETNKKKEGQWMWYYEIGQVQSIYHYTNDSLVGTFTEYHEDGVLKEKGTYNEQHEPIGTWETYTSLGILYSHKTYSKDAITLRLYHCESGLLEKRIIKKHDGTKNVTKFHTNGRTYQTLLYKNDKIVSVIACYDDEGNMLDKGSLKKGKGTVIHYFAFGEPYMIETYSNGDLTNTKKLVDFEVH